jgi:hypothetical protein
MPVPDDKPQTPDASTEKPATEQKGEDVVRPH